MADPYCFRTSGAVLPDSTYIQRAADAELFEYLSVGEYCYVLAARQMGKSSLLWRTAGRQRLFARCQSYI
jgi:hypothetical protein